MADQLNIGPRPGARVEKKLNLQSQASGKRQVGASVGSMLVESLVAYSGAIGEQYSKKVAKEVEADKAVQMSRAVQGFLPTDNATKAGVKSHVAVNSQKEALGAQARLQQLAKTDITDDQWEEAIRLEFKNLDTSLTDTYPSYGKDVELQKLSSLAMREIIPSATAVRETAKVGYEIKHRMNTATDAIINNAAANPTTDMLKETETILNSLQLTESQKDQTIIDAALNTRDPDILNLAKQYKGARNTSLFDRTGSLQTLDGNLKNEAISDHAIQINIERNTLDEAYLRGDIDENQWRQAHVNRNADLENRFSTPSQMDAVQAKKDKLTVADYKSSDLIRRMQNDSITDFSQDKPEDIQGAFDELLYINQKSILNQAKELPVEDQVQFIKDKTTAVIGYMGDIATKGNDTIDAWTADLSNLANLNIPTAITEADVRNFKVEQLSTTAQRAIQLIDGMSDTARDEHFDKIGSKEGKTLRHFMNMRDMGMPLPQALDRAQTLTRNPSPINIAAVNSGVKDVISNLEFTWFRPDFSDNQEAYLQNEIREKVMIDPTPDSKSNVDLVISWMKKKWTTVGNLWLKGSPDYLSSATGLHAEKLENAMEGYVQLHRERVLPQLEGLGLTMADVFPVTDPNRGTVELHTSTGFKVPGTRQSLGDLRKVASDWKVEKEQKVWKEMEKAGALRQVYTAEEKEEAFEKLWPVKLLRKLKD